MAKETIIKADWQKEAAEKFVNHVLKDQEERKKMRLDLKKFAKANKLKYRKINKTHNLVEVELPFCYRVDNFTMNYPDKLSIFYSDALEHPNIELPCSDIDGDIKITEEFLNNLSEFINNKKVAELKFWVFASLNKDKNKRAGEVVFEKPGKKTTEFYVETIFSKELLICPKCNEIDTWVKYTDNCGCVERNKKDTNEKKIKKRSKIWKDTITKSQKEDIIPGMLCINVETGIGFQTKFIDVSAIKGVTIDENDPDTDTDELKWEIKTQINLICDPTELSQEWEFTSEDPKNPEAMKFYKNLLKEINDVRN
jgi:hypothetical protein